MKLCMGCMEMIEDTAKVCPNCGFDEQNVVQESYYLTPGTIVGGRYIIGKPLKYNGYTITYLGMDAENNQKVYIQEYLPSDFSTRSDGEKEVTIYSGDAVEQFNQGLTTFLNEANQIQQLGEIVGVAKVYDCVAENDTGYVITEYLEGQTLKECLEIKKQYSVDEAMEYIKAILTGLSALHPLNVIHCDISPETIFVTDEGEVKLLDFGATRYVTTANSKSLAIILKQGYAPEEQYRSRGERGPWTDVYAVAAVMYRMITGIVPEESVERALVDELKEPSKLNVDITENVENALMNALNIYQHDRTKTAGAFLMQLSSQQVKRIYVKTKNNETGKLPIWAKISIAALLVLVLAGGGIYFLTRNNDTTTIENVAKKVEDYVGKSEKDASVAAKNQGLDVEINYVFNKDVVDEVIAQDLASGSDLGDAKKIVLTVQTNESISIKELTDLYQDSQDAREMAMSLGNEGLAKAGDKNDASKVYGVLDYIDTSNKQIDSTQLTDSTERIKVADITGLYYYISPFFYEKNVQDYIGKNIQDVGVMDLYKVENQTPTPTGSKSKPNANPLYYSFNQSEGYIVKQTIKNGLYDSRKTSSLFSTVKEQIKYNGKNGKDLRDELTKDYYLNKNNITIRGGKDTDKIDKVTIENGDGNKKDCFSKENAKNVKIVITTKLVATPAPTPVPTSASTPSQNIVKPTPTGDTDKFF